MSRCSEIRDLLLEASPQELAGRDDSSVARHVAECPACGKVAALLLEETAALDRALAFQGPPDVDAILDAALGTHGHTGSEDSAAATGDPATRTLTGAGARVLPFPSWTRWTVLAAAAVATILFLQAAPDAGSPGRLASRLSETPPLVESAPNHNVAVMETANPDITVLWFFQ